MSYMLMINIGNCNMTNNNQNHHIYTLILQSMGEISLDCAFDGYLICPSQMGWNGQVGRADDRSIDDAVIEGSTDAKG